jgi:hypothetical protein
MLASYPRLGETSLAGSAPGLQRLDDDPVLASI